MNAAASTSTASSPSWAGYLNHTNDVNEVWGQWIVPSAYDTSTPYGNWAESYTWVGMGGFTDTAFISGNHGNIMQAGTEQNMIMNNYQQQAAYYFWWECYPYNAEQIVNLAVNPGDSVYSQVWYTTNNGGTMNYFMENYTTGQSTSGALSGVSAYYDPTEAEWIEEDPTLDGGGGRANLADFGSVNLQDCYSYSPTQGTQSISGYNNLRINMGSKASTGGLNSSGDGFTVTWHNFN